MIVCTEKDKEFEKYKDKVKNRKVIFTIKEIFEDWWNKFLESFPNLNIRDVVFSNVTRMLKCKTWDLGYTVFKCHECGYEKVVPHTCKSRLHSLCCYKYELESVESVMQKVYKLTASELWPYLIHSYENMINIFLMPLILLLTLCGTLLKFSFVGT